MASKRAEFQALGTHSEGSTFRYLSFSQMAYQLLHKTPVQEALDQAMAERLRKIGVHSERVFQGVLMSGGKRFIYSSSC